MRELIQHCGRTRGWLCGLKSKKRNAHAPWDPDHQHVMPTTPWPYPQNKGARKRLVRALTAEMPAGALALLPFYARIAATLAQVFPDVSAGE